MKRFNSSPIGKSVQIFQRKKEGIWYASYTVELRQVTKSLRTTKLNIASKLATEISDDLDRNTHTVIEMPESLEEAVNQFFEYLKSENRGKGTIKRYRPIFNRFLDFCKNKKVTQFKQLDQRLLELYREDRIKSASKSTRYLESKCIVAFGKYLARNKIVNVIPFSLEGIKKPKIEPLVWFKQKDIDNILSLAKDRDKALFEFLAFTGLRISEVKRLAWADIDLEKGSIIVKSTAENPTKNGTSRMVPMHDRVKNILKSMEVKSELVFHSGKSSKYPDANGPLSERRVLTKIKKICLKLGIEGCVHSFRKFFCSYMANSGVPATTLIKWSGHSDLKVLMDHYYKLENSESIKFMDKVSEKDVKKEDAENPLGHSNKNLELQELEKS